MNIKEIVEGMTAPLVAQVIKDNFNEVDKDKANKTDLNKSISDLTSVVEANKTDLTEKIDNNKEDTDAKLSELGSEEGISLAASSDIIKILRGNIEADGSYRGWNPNIRLCTSYISSPFTLEVHDDLLIYNKARYNIINGVPTFVGKFDVNSKQLSQEDDKYVYRIVFASKDLTSEINDELLSNAILQFKGKSNIEMGNTRSVVFPTIREIGSYNCGQYFHQGSIVITNNGWEYIFNDNRVTLKEGFAIALQEGDVIGLSNWANMMIYIGWRRLDGTYGTSEQWLYNNYTITEKGYYVIIISSRDGSKLDVGTTVNNLNIIINNSISSLVVQNKADISSLRLFNFGELQIIRGGIDSNGEINKSVSELRCCTDYIKAPFNLKIKGDVDIYKINYYQNINGKFKHIRQTDAIDSKALSRDDKYIYRITFKSSLDSSGVIPDAAIESMIESFIPNQELKLIKHNELAFEYHKEIFGPWDVSNTLEMGSIVINNDGWGYVEHEARVRTKENRTFALQEGDVIGLSNWTNMMMYVGWRRPDGTYGTGGSWMHGNYTITEKGYYVVTFSRLDGSELPLDFIKYDNFFVESKSKTLSSVVRGLEYLSEEGNINYYGDKLSIQLPIQHRCKRTKVYSEKWGQGNIHNRAQSMAIHNDKVFVFLDNSGSTQSLGVVVYNFNDWSLVGEYLLPIASHQNNAQFSNVYYNENDAFPLLLLSRGDYPDGISAFYSIRITEFEGQFKFETIRTIYCSIPESKNNGSWVANFNQNRLWMYCLTKGDWRVPEDEGNRLNLYEFELPDLTSTNDLTLTNEDVVRVSNFDYAILQGATENSGRIFLSVANVTKINNNPITLAGKGAHYIMVINPDNGRVENVIKGGDYEDEGIAIYNGKLYVNSKVGGDSFAEDKEVFQIYQYEF